MAVDIRTLLQNRVIALTGQPIDPNSSPTFVKVSLTGSPTNTTDAITKGYLESQGFSTTTLTNTDGLAEGDVNLYYTDARARLAFSASGAID